MKGEIAMAKCIYARCKRTIPPDAIFCPYCGRKQVREQKPKKHRTREKGTGSVYKLSGNRKRPYYAVLNGKSAGRMYATRQEAEAALESMLACIRRCSPTPWRTASTPGPRWPSGT
jgi:hypothetical protein